MLFQACFFFFLSFFLFSFGLAALYGINWLLCLFPVVVLRS